MFKFVAKGDNYTNESALFFNGQRVCTVYAGVNPDGSMEIQIEDGNGRLMTEWEDFAEDYEQLIG